jgi:two-component system, OmpR family, response regulator
MTLDVVTPVKLQRILYVEDQPDIQLVARMALVKLGGFDVMVCSSGVEALQTAPTFMPDLLLLDVMMPGMDGPDTLRALRRLDATSHTPAIFLTARNSPEDASSYLAAGAIDLISKPFDPMTLANTVRAIWDRYHASLSA